MYLLAAFALLLVVMLIHSIMFIAKSRKLKKKVREKLSRINTTDSREWTSQFLQEKRRVTDPLADQLVNEIMEKKEERKVNHLFQSIIHDTDVLPEDSPEELKMYFNETEKLPAWADEDLIDLGQQVYIRHGVWISLLLCYKSLPECYACAKGAEVLYRTGRLNEHDGSLKVFNRRIAETAQFVLFTMSPNGLSKKGSGIRSAQKVRLIHAVIRYFLWQKGWDSGQFGEPVNHEDQAGTLMSFSALILEGLRVLNINLTDEEKEAYIHCWRVIGHFMGLEDDILPKNAKEATALGYAILDNQIAESIQGKILTHALLDFQNETYKAFCKEEDNIAIMRLMMGDRISDKLGLAKVDESKVMKWQNKMRRMARIAEFLENTVLFTGSVQILSRILLQLMLKLMTSSGIINFYLPRTLKKDWNFSANKT